MAQQALGNVQPASTTVGLPATNNLANPAQNFNVQALQFQALGTNTSSVYIVDRQTPNLALNVLAEIPPPSATPATRPGWTIGNPTAPAALDASTFWILPAVAGEGVRVTAVR